jgi:hypothetical protein
LDDRFENRGQQLETRAADSGRVIGVANNAGDFLNMIEDGQFSQDLHRELADLAATMSDLATGHRARSRRARSPSRLTSSHREPSRVARCSWRAPSTSSKSRRRSASRPSCSPTSTITSPAPSRGTASSSASATIAVAANPCVEVRLTTKKRKVESYGNGKPVQPDGVGNAISESACGGRAICASLSSSQFKEPGSGITAPALIVQQGRDRERARLNLRRVPRAPRFAAVRRR